MTIDDVVWTMLVGGSSGGKTEILKALDSPADAHLSEFTVAGMLSATSKGKPIGLLSRLQEEREILICIRDFSSILTQENRHGRSLELSMMRELYDGRVTRTIHEGQIQWEGRVTMLAACTHAIDHFTSHTNALGTRWIYLRMPELSRAAERQAMKRLGELGKEERQRWRYAFANVLGAVIMLGQERLDQDPAKYEADDDVNERIEDFSSVGSGGRASIPRSSYGAREMTGLPDKESPMRLHSQLLQIYQGARAVGLSTEKAVALSQRMAIDSMPRQRAIALRALAHAGKGGVTEAAAARKFNIDRKVVGWALQDLEAAGMAVSHRAKGRGNPTNFQTSQEYRRPIAATFGGDE